MKHISIPMMIILLAVSGLLAGCAKKAPQPPEKSTVHEAGSQEEKNEPEPVRTELPAAQAPQSPEESTVPGTYPPEKKNAPESVHTEPSTSQSATIQTEGNAQNIQITGIRKVNPAINKRFHYVAFTLNAPQGSNSIGRFTLGLKQKDSPAPSADQLRGGASLHRKITDTAKAIILAYTIDSGIQSFLPTVIRKEVVHGASSGKDIDRYFLTPGRTYTLYAVKDGTDNVYTLKDFTTDSLDNRLMLTSGATLDPALYGNTYTYDHADEFFVVPIGFALPDNGFHSYLLVGKEDIPLVSGIGFNNATLMGNPMILSQAALLTPSLGNQTGTVMQIGGQYVWYTYLLLWSMKTDGGLTPIELHNTTSRKIVAQLFIASD